MAAAVAAAPFPPDNRAAMGSAVPDLSAVAPGLLPGADGIWRGPAGPEVHYPDDGSDAAFAVEDSSWWFAHRNRVILGALRRALPPPATFLDIGAGNGFVSRGLRGAGYGVALLEPSEAGARNARGRGLPNVACAAFAPGLFAPGSFDGAGLFDVIEHVEDDAGLLRAVRGVLRPGGVVAVTVPAMPSLFSSDDAAAGHFRRYTRRSLGAALAAAGFEAARTAYFMAALVPAVFAARRLPSLLGLRRGLDRARDTREHGDGLLGRSLGAALAPEAALLSRGGTMPLGTSLLGLARAPAAG